MSIRKMILIFAFLLLIAGGGLVACSSTPNYLSPDGPRYAGNYSSIGRSYGGGPRTITWNIKFSQNIDEVIQAFRENQAAMGWADVILLQEMDADGVDAIARAMRWHYVYYPASVHPKTGRDFGEAILSPWPLSDDAKIILPHASPRNGQIRIAVRARVQTPDDPTLVYSVHTETALMSPDQRQDQVQALLDDIPADAPSVIIGGDFNTLSPVERAVLLQMMQASGLDWLTEAAGATVQEGGVGAIMDYIFARGFETQETGVVETDVSDHLPLWVTTARGE